MTQSILQINSSARVKGSLSREVTEYIASKLAQQYSAALVQRDLATTDLPLITEAHIG